MTHNKKYFSFLAVLKQLQGVIDVEDLAQRRKKLSQYHTADIAVQYCDMQWNKKSNIILRQLNSEKINKNL